jgi:hypothetical protein
MGRRFHEARDVPWTLPAERDDVPHRDAEPVDPNSEAKASFFETSRAPGDDGFEAPTVRQLLFELGVILAVIMGLGLAIQLLLVAYGIPRP